MRINQLPTRTVYRFAVSIFFCIYGFIFANWVSRIPDIKATLELNDQSLGIVLLFLPIGQLCAMALSGYIVAKCAFPLGWTTFIERSV